MMYCSEDECTVKTVLATTKELAYWEQGEYGNFVKLKVSFTPVERGDRDQKLSNVKGHQKHQYNYA